MESDSEIQGDNNNKEVVHWWHANTYVFMYVLVYHIIASYTYVHTYPYAYM